MVAYFQDHQSVHNFVARSRDIFFKYRIPTLTNMLCRDGLFCTELLNVMKGNTYLAIHDS